MKKYRVYATETVYYCFEVEGKNETDAINNAIDIPNPFDFVYDVDNWQVDKDIFEIKD